MIHPWNQALWSSLPPFDRLPPVLLLNGPRGVGKRAFAQALAQALLCPAPAPSRAACADCQSCRLFSSGNHPDYRILEPISGPNDEDGNAEEGSARGKAAQSARWIKVDAVRALADFLSLTSHLGGTKLVLIDPADRLHPSAANALLKTLEEPANSRFILVTSQPARLPATVRSRCMRVPVSVPDGQVAVDWLRTQGVSDPGAVLAHAGGAPLAALEAGTSDQWQIRRVLIDRILAEPRFDPVAAADAIGVEQVPLLVATLQRWCYDLLLSQACGKLRYYPDCAQILHPMARRVVRYKLLGFVRQLQEVARHVEHPLNQRLLAERCLIGYRNAIAGPEN